MGGGSRLADEDWELVTAAEAAAAIPDDQLDDEARARLTHQICHQIVKELLDDFLAASRAGAPPPAAAAAAAADAPTFEDWVRHCHPENCGEAVGGHGQVHARMYNRRSVHRVLWNDAMRSEPARQVAPRAPPPASPPPPTPSTPSSATPTSTGKLSLVARPSLVTFGLGLVLALGLMLAHYPTSKQHARLAASALHPPALLPRRPHAALVAGGRQLQDPRTTPQATPPPPAPPEEPRPVPPELAPTDAAGLAVRDQDADDAASLLSGPRVRMGLSAALGMAGLWVGVPWVPGLTDNVLMGLGLAALPTETFQEWAANSTVPLPATVVEQAEAVAEHWKRASEAAAGQWKRLAQVARSFGGSAAPAPNLTP